jgi:predicted ATPase/DNA-binding CsgD family transcriptional regulator
MAVTYRDFPPSSIAIGTLNQLGGHSAGGFVGRDSELGSIDHLVELASHGHGQAVIIQGEVGVGKSALCREVARRACDRGAALLTFHSSSGESNCPFGPLVGGLRGAMRSSHGQREWLAVIVSEIEQAIHALSEQFDTRELEIIGPSAAARLMASRRRRAFDVFVDGLIAMAHGFKRSEVRSPLVLVFEDLHWADESTLDLLEYLFHVLTHDSGDSADAKPIAVLATCRAEEARPGSRLKSMIHDVVEQRLVHKIKLRALSRHEQESLTSQLLGSSIPPELTDDLWDVAEGNPLLVEEIVAGARNAGMLRRKAVGWEYQGRGSLGLADSVLDLVLSPLQGISEETRSVLALAAVMGRSFAFESLEAASDLDETKLSAALKEASGFGIIEEFRCEETPGRGGDQGTDDITYRFCRAALRQAIDQSLLTCERRALRVRVNGVQVPANHTTVPDVFPNEPRRHEVAGSRPGLVGVGLRVAPREYSTPIQLTPREHEVLELLACGLKNREIAEVLVIEKCTAELHVSRILGKLGCSTRAEAAAHAIRQGLVPFEISGQEQRAG